MGLLNISTALLALLSTYASAEASPAAVSRGAAAPDRMLRAATKRSDLFRRSMRVHKRFEAELSYVEGENDWSNKPVFASQVKVGSQAPILNLEEMEHFLQDLKCGPGSMKLHFVDKVTARDAMHACSGGTIITSHEGCNKEGERAVYKVANVGVTDDGLALDLDVVESKWNEAFSKFDISFGHTSDSHLYRRHDDFQKVRKRQAGTSTVSVAPPKTSGGFVIPSNTSDNINTVTISLASERLNRVFTADDFTSGLSKLPNIPGLPGFPKIPGISNITQLPVEIGCKNCSTTGSVVLTQGLINIDMKQVDLIPDFLQGGDDKKDLLNVITGGFFELSANGVGAHVELFARPKVNGAFEITLFELPTPAGFVIPKIGRAGVTFEASLAVDFNLVKPGIEVNYGFDIAVPDKSSIRVDLNNLAGSRVVGFPNTKLTPRPVSVNISEVELVIGAALIPNIPIGFQFLESLEASVNVAMALPRLDLKLSTKKNADCKSISGQNNTTPALKPNGTAPSLQPGTPLAQLGPLFLVEANVTISVDVGASLEFPLLPPGLNSIETEVNVFETQFVLAKTCVPAGRRAATTPVLSSTSKKSSQASSTKYSASKITPTSKPLQPSVGRSTAISNSTGIWTKTKSATNIPPAITLPPRSSGFFLGTGGIPGNGALPTLTRSLNTTNSSSPIQFTGAASPQFHTPEFSIGSAWQFCLVGIGAIAGAMLVL